MASANKTAKDINEAVRKIKKENLEKALRGELTSSEQDFSEREVPRGRLFAFQQWVWVPIIGPVIASAIVYVLGLGG